MIPQIRFTYLPHDDEPPAPCILCKKPTTQWAAYSPPGATIKRPVCLDCGSKVWSAWELIQIFRGFSK